MRVLLIDDKAKTEIERVRSFAHRHHFHPALDPAPGDNPCYVAELGTFRCVYSLTHVADQIYRHLSISVPADGNAENYPGPLHAFSIADAFGFTGWSLDKGDAFPASWAVSADKMRRCIIIMQALDKHDTTETRH